MNPCKSCVFYNVVCFDSTTHISSNSSVYPAKATIFEEGTSLKGLYCITKGVCKILKLSEHGSEQIIQFLGKKTLLGIRSLISEEYTNLRAVALTEVYAQFIPLKAVKHAIATDPEFCEKLLKTFAKYVKHADNRIVAMGQHQVGERLAIFLLELKRQFGTKEDGSIAIYLKREEMANFIGTATESMIRTLKQFERNGWIKTYRKGIYLQNIDALHHLAKGCHLKLV